jgi:hypothetical protein
MFLKLDDTQLDFYFPEFMVIMVEIMIFEFKMCDGFFYGVENYTIRFSDAKILRV